MTLDWLAPGVPRVNSQEAFARTEVIAPGLTIEIIDNSMSRPEADRVMNFAKNLYDRSDYGGAIGPLNSIIKYHEKLAAEAYFLRLKSEFMSSNRDFLKTGKKIISLYGDHKIITGGEFEKTLFKMLSISGKALKKQVLANRVEISPRTDMINPLQFLAIYYFNGKDISKFEKSYNDLIMKVIKNPIEIDVFSKVGIGSPSIVERRYYKDWNGYPYLAEAAACVLSQRIGPKAAYRRFSNNPRYGDKGAIWRRCGEGYGRKSTYRLTRTELPNGGYAFSPVYKNGQPRKTSAKIKNLNCDRKIKRNYGYDCVSNNGDLKVHWNVEIYPSELFGILPISVKSRLEEDKL